MPINSFLYPGAKTTPAYEVANSVRFNGADSPALKRNSMGTATNRKKWTLSMWVKRAGSCFLSCGPASGDVSLADACGMQ